MPALNRHELRKKIASTIEALGWAVSYNAIPANRPFRMHITKETEAKDLLLYVWTITRGGPNTVRPANEFRIQFTAVGSIDLVANYTTLILGYSPTYDVFAAWDPAKHAGAVTGESPSQQIREEYLVTAANQGFSVCPRGRERNELVIAFNSAFLINYISNQRELHGAGDSDAEVRALEIIAERQGEVGPADLGAVSEPRRRVLMEIARNERDYSFRRRVATAYNHRCAVCGMQLNLIDAAHIVPVNHQDSTDETVNGLCLCVLHHRALDAKLLAVLPDYRVVVNRQRLEQLRQDGRGEGKARFLDALLERILLPADRVLYPSPTMLETAIRVRDLPLTDLVPPADLR